MAVDLNYVHRVYDNAVQAGPEGLAERLCAMCVLVLPMDWASLWMADEDGWRIWASGEVADRIDQLELAADEGPCLTAARTGQLAQLSDAASPEQSAWPAFAAEAARIGARAVYGAPVQLAGVLFGSLNVGRARPGPLSPQERAALRLMAGLTAQALAGDPSPSIRDLARANEDDARRALESWGPDVARAVDALAGPVGLHPEEGMALLRAGAFAQQRTLHDVAQDVLASARSTGVEAAAGGEPERRTFLLPALDDDQQASLAALEDVLDALAGGEQGDVDPPGALPEALTGGTALDVLRRVTAALRTAQARPAGGRLLGPDGHGYECCPVLAVPLSAVDVDALLAAGVALQEPTTPAARLAVQRGLEPAELVAVLQQVAEVLALAWTPDLDMLQDRLAEAELGAEVTLSQEEDAAYAATLARLSALWPTRV